MFRGIFAVLVVSLLFFGVSGLSFAQTGKMENKKDSAVSAQAVDAGNKICPVTGEKIDEKMKATYEYKGKIYNFCCAMCIDEFKKNPDKYIKKVQEELAKDKVGK